MALKDWSETASSNDDADATINWLEGQAPSTVNGSARSMMAVIKKALGGIISVKDYGATGDGTTDDTSAIQACIDAVCDAGGGTVYFDKGTYNVTSTLSVDTSGVQLVGRGRTGVKIKFSPTANDVLLSFTAGASMIRNWSLRDLTLYSEDSTYTKTALEIIDGGEYLVDNIEITGNVDVGGTDYWSGSNSIGIHIKGREAGVINNVWVVADRPLLIGVNPNSFIDIDHHNFHNFQVIANGNPCIEISSNVDLTNVTFTGHQAWVLGTHGLYWVDTGTSSNSYQLVLENVRREQSNATDYNVRIEHNNALQTLIMRNCQWDDLQEGFYLRNVRRVIFDGCTYSALSGRQVLNMTGITNSVLQIDNSIIGNGGTVTLTNMVRVFESRPTQTTHNFGETALYAFNTRFGLRHSVVATASLPAASAANMDGTIVIEDAGSGNRNIVIYAGGERFRIDGGTAF